MQPICETSCSWGHGGLSLIMGWFQFAADRLHEIGLILMSPVQIHVNPVNEDQWHKLALCKWWKPLTVGYITSRVVPHDSLLMILWSLIELSDQPVVIALTDDNPELAIGDKTSLRCKSMAYPRPQVSWFRDNVPIRYVRHSLTPASFTDRWTLTCFFLRIDRGGSCC